MDRLDILKEIFEGSWLADTGIGQYEDKYTAVRDLVKQNQINVALFVLFVFLAIRQVVSKNREAAKKGMNREYLDAPDFPEIERLEKFDWKKEDPIKLRLFKPKYHLTMGEFGSYVACVNPLCFRGH